MCIFCMIKNKEIPAKVIYEDDEYLSFLDLSQTTKGHSLVIPKKHVENFIELDESSNYLKVCQKVSKALIKTFNASGINMLSNAGVAAGQTVMHCHIHLIPRYENDSFNINFVDNQDKFDLDELKNLIIKNI